MFTHISFNNSNGCLDFIDICFIINVREYRGSNNKWTIQRYLPHRVRNTMCLALHYTQANTNNVNKTLTLLQTTGCKDERNIVFMRKSQRISQRGTQNVKTHNRTTQKLKILATRTPWPPRLPGVYPCAIAGENRTK